MFLRTLTLVSAALALTGCYIPMTFPETGADELNSDFAKVTLLVDPGCIEVSLEDEDKDLRGLQFVSAEFATPDDKRVSLQLREQKYKFEPNSGTSLHKAFFALALENKRSYPRGEFQLTVVTRLGPKTLMFSGKFSEHHRTEMINLYNALNHG